MTRFQKLTQIGEQPPTLRGSNNKQRGFFLAMPIAGVALIFSVAGTAIVVDNHDTKEDISSISASALPVEQAQVSFSDDSSFYE